LAGQGNATAQYRLGFAHWSGHGVPQDQVEGIKWWRRAADQGLSDAQYMLGSAYSHAGRGVPLDYVQAYKWYSLAASRLSDEVARQLMVERRDETGLRMSPRQIAEAQNLVREWRPQSPKIALIERPTTTRTPSSRVGEAFSPTGVPLKKVGGTFVVPVEINGAITLDFTVDSGAADVSVPADVFSTLTRTGTIRDTDLIGEQTYVLGDGSEVKSITFTIRSLEIGGTVVENVRGSVASANGSLLLGQSFLERFKSWSIDNTKHVLLLEP